MFASVPHGISAPVLVLSRSYRAVRVITGRQAFEMLFMGRALALDRDYQTYDFERWTELTEDSPDGSWEMIGTVSGRLRVPRLLVLQTLSRARPARARLSRRNVFLRDQHTCQYCDRTLPLRDLSLDHVIPRSRGGGFSWDNLVTACQDCNRRKGQKLTNECGMVPTNPPKRPRWSVVIHRQISLERFAEWKPFLLAG